jgi:hypothetical protein
MSSTGEFVAWIWAALPSRRAIPAVVNGADLRLDLVLMG